MANQSEKYIKNSIAYAGAGTRFGSNAPVQYSDSQKQYMSNQTRLFVQDRAYLSGDYVKAEVQGITNEFYDYVTTYVRLSDLFSPSINPNARMDDFKEVLFADPKIQYIPIGAKIQTMGSVWLVINPSNIGAAETKTVVVRCNSSYNSYDFYGNVVTEPIYVERTSMLGNENEYKKNLVLMDGYFNVTCQLNPNTQTLGQNKRFVLGTKPYFITGFTDFIQEFTGNRESVHLLNFTARIEEPTELDDVSNNFIANGNSYIFSASIDTVGETIVGSLVTINPRFLLNGIEVEPTPTSEISWTFESSDSSVLQPMLGGGIETEIGGNSSETWDAPYPDIQLKKIYGKLCTIDGAYSNAVPNPIVRIVLNDNQTINIPQNLEYFGYSAENYIFSDNGKTYYHQGARWSSDYYDHQLEPGEHVIDTVYDSGVVIALADPIITDITSLIDFSDVYSNIEAITVISAETEESLAQDAAEYYEGYTYNVGNVLISLNPQYNSVFAKATGTAFITAKMLENEAITADVAITVVEGASAPYVAFKGIAGTTLRQYSSATYSAAYFDGGQETDEPVTWSLSGSSAQDYEVYENGNEITIQCVSPSDTPLLLTASYGTYTASVSILLEGY